MMKAKTFLGRQEVEEGAEGAGCAIAHLFATMCCLTIACLVSSALLCTALLY
jgi:hypothetical protein